MEKKALKNLHYKTRASLALNDEILDFEEIEKSWLKAEQNNKTYIIKTIDIDSNEKFKFSVSNQVLKVIKESHNPEVFIGCIYENHLQRIKINNIKLTNTNVKDSYICIDKKFSQHNSSHFDFDKEDSISIKFEIVVWQNFEDTASRIKALSTTQRLKEFGSDFNEWYKNKEKKCCYCGVKEDDLTKYFNSNNSQYVEARQRGQYLEIERIVTAPKEKNVYSKENTDLTCYICNNAKSDFLSAKKFRPIAKGIYKFWKEEVGISNIVFPENSEIWDME